MTTLTRNVATLIHSRALLAGAMLCSLSLFGAETQPASTNWVFKLVTERTNSLYKLDEEVSFKFEVKQGGQAVTSGKADYVLDDEGPNQLGKGQVTLGDAPVVIKGKMSQPGFLRCRVSYKLPDGKTTNLLAAAGISPELIKPSLPVPNDFDAFWADQKAKLAKVPMNPKLTSVKSPAKELECFDVQVDCLGGAPVSGYLAKPVDAKPKSLPVILFVHGAGVRSSQIGSAVNGAKNGMLAMDINAHGIPNGQPDKFYTDLAEGKLKDYRYAGRESRDTCYFLGMYLRLVRAIDFLTSQPEWNGKVVIVTGHSQGGGQSLVAGGLDPRVTIIAAGVPAMCDHSGLVVNRINGWPKLVPNGADGKPDPKILEVARYFDAVNFATRCKADAMMSVGFIDSTCPPSSCYSAYNQLRGTKEIIHEPLMGHAAPPQIQTAFMKMIVEHAKKQGM